VFLLSISILKRGDIVPEREEKEEKKREKTET
jgi:hypothetical protein